ncbi:MAG: response regulator transcription factor [Elusimicrobiota bacterium]
MRYKIMVADDDPSIRRIVEVLLKKAGYSIVLCESGNEVLAKAQKSNPDLLLMDVLLGDADGRKLCTILKKEPATRHIPIVLMTATRKKDEDMVSGLRGGADDYLFKPMSPPVLLAKVEAVLRRLRAPEQLREVLELCGLTLNVSQRTVKLKGKEIELSRKEFDLLTVLLRKRDEVLSPNFLLETVWGYEIEDYNDPHTVHVHMSRLKKKLGKSFASRIQNIIGSGYKLS